MATTATHDIQRDRYAASASQAALAAEISRHRQLQDEFHKARATQAAICAQLNRVQAERKQEIADQDFRFAGTHYDEQRIDILLQGFNAISHVLNNISYTSAVVMGFASTMFVLQRVDNTRRELKYVFWTLALLTIKFHVQAVFVATLAVTDSTKLCYQGTKGREDVERAFHGLMAQRSDVFWNFMGGFIAFIVLTVFLVWVKIEQDTNTEISDDLLWYGATLTVVSWLVPVARLARSYRATRRSFKIDYSDNFVEESVDDSDDEIAHGQEVDGLQLAVGPQSLRRKAERERELADQVLSSMTPHVHDGASVGSPRAAPPATLGQAAMGYRAALAITAAQATPDPFGGSEGRVAFFASLSQEHQHRVLEVSGRQWRPGGAPRPGEHYVTTFAALSDHLQERALRRFAEEQVQGEHRLAKAHGYESPRRRVRRSIVPTESGSVAASSPRR
eukprot:TRINITY_DN30703_c0_g1_i1.p1 TRINITY_DN30703_c0_g1~~TRINITY_DN30703_c0_g1_i1.p1  ORF type:complete len:449 (+),score=54.80 TRINITY_DN30703_c0_g1_i1:57-1403(+)